MSLSSLDNCRVSVTTVFLTLRAFECSEISLSFSDTGHSGDRRRKAQYCSSLAIGWNVLNGLIWIYKIKKEFRMHFKYNNQKSLPWGLAGTTPIHKIWAFSGSKSLLGTIGPIARARVCELVNFDPDRALSPPHRVPWLFSEVAFWICCNSNIQPWEDHGQTKNHWGLSAWSSCLQRHHWRPIKWGPGGGQNLQDLRCGHLWRAGWPIHFDSNLMIFIRPFSTKLN